MLGDIQDGLEGDREDRDDQTRRLQLENCVNTTEGFQPRGSCNETSCQDESRICDGSYNYPYIAKLITGE